jgi:hypothetical protein
MTHLPIPWRRSPVGQIDPATAMLPAPVYHPDPASATSMGIPVTILPPEAATVPDPVPRIPPRWAVSLVCLVLILAGVLVGVGKPVGIVMETLSGSGFIAVELVRRINREL